MGGHLAEEPEELVDVWLHLSRKVPARVISTAHGREVGQGRLDTPGRLGKRLALRREMAARRPEGVCLVDLCHLIPPAP
jgi:hypothetical protein